MNNANSGRPEPAPNWLMQRVVLVALSAAFGGGALAEERRAPVEAGQTFRDCAVCPLMMVLPEGAFPMGSAVGEENEKPVREVAIRSFAIGVTEVTFDTWDACADEGYCRPIPSDVRLEPMRKRFGDQGWGRERRPAIDVSWSDITGEGVVERGFLAWMNAQVDGAPYRLPSEAEWEYAARAGAETPYWFGDTITEAEANFASNFRGGRSREVGSYPANGFGLFDMSGNLWEWVADCEHASHEGAPADGTARGSEGGGDCGRAIMRGGGWNSDGAFLRSAFRISGRRDVRDKVLGFRVARDLGG